MLSGLPIVYNDPVRSILVSEHYRASLGEATMDYPSKYIPRTFPICGLYNDYGGLKSVKDDVFKHLWVQGLQTDLFELSVGENECHDIAVTRDMDFDQLWEAIWEERLIVPGYWCYGEKQEETIKKVPKPEDLPSRLGMRNVRVQVAMIREDVWQSVMASPFKSWRDDFPTILGSMRSLVYNYWAECQSSLASAKHLENLTTQEERSSIMLKGEDIFSIRGVIQGNRSSICRFDHYLSSLIKDECGLGLGSHWLMALEGTVKPEQLEYFLAGVAEMIWFKLVNEYRGPGNLWKPSYAGGQDRPWGEWLSYHLNMAVILNGIIKREE
jgi:hypothetical protein